MGMFDDLVPQKKAGMFDDLIPGPPIGRGDDYTGTILPMSRKGGETSFDPNVGILGAFKRTFEGPGDVYTGKLDPRSPEGLNRAREAAMVMSPMPAVSRAMRGGYKTVTPKAPSAEALNVAKTAGYKEAGEAGVEFTGASVKKFADDLESELNSKFIIEKNVPQVFSYIRHLQNPEGGAVMPLPLLNEFRKRLGEYAGKTADPDLAFASTVAIRKLDEFLETVDPASVVVRTPAPKGSRGVTRQGHDFHADDAAASQATAEQAVTALNEARGNAAALFRSDRVTGMERTAARRTAAANSGKNTDNAIRQRLTSLIESAKGSRGLTEKEIAAVDDIIFGRNAKNAARYLGNKFGGGGGNLQTVLQILLATAGGEVAGAGGIAAGVGLPMILGSMGRGTANQMSKREVKRLDDLLRTRSPLHEKAVKKARPQFAPEGDAKSALVRALIGKFDPADKNRWY